MVWAELLGGLTSVLIAVALWRLYPDYDENYLSALFGLIVHAAIAGALLYLSVYDIFTLSIPTRATLYTTLAAVVANVAALAFGYVLPGFTSGLGELDNLLAGVVAGGLIWVIIIITKQRGMGLGDIYIALLIGLLLGWPGIVTAFYVMLLSATGFGLLWALYIGKFKGLQVPLVPFMTLGYLVGLGWGVGVFDFLFFGI
jgi:prepilin signal peptidase PulO-like enzyme (type II secretory pathway)